MPTSDSQSPRQRLEQAIAAQESLRGVIDDAVLETTLAALRRQLAELTPAPDVKQLRKLVSVLFVDIVSSTQLTRGLDPEENMAVMDSALQQLSGPVAAHGGRVLRFMGDGFLAVFGLPQARENDAEMAVRAGLGILEAAREIARDLQREHRLEGFQVRAGLNTGLVVSGGVTEAEDTIMGSTVNLAARMESAAPPGGLLISHDTYQHVRGLFDFEPGQPIQAKGFAQAVQVYRVQRAKPRAFRLMTRGVEGVVTRMVGRQQEMQTLQAAAETVVQGPGSRFVTVVGEAGLGKSRLLDEFESWLDLQPAAFTLFKGRATLEMLDLPYALLRDLLAFRFRILDDDPVAVLRDKFVDGFRQAHGGAGDWERNAHFVGQLLGYDFRSSPHLQGILSVPQQLHSRALAYLAEYFRALAAGGPVAVFLDDIHWADQSSLAALVQLSRELSGQRIFFAALARPTLFERQPGWGQAPQHEQIALQPLSPPESQSLIGTVLRQVQDLPDTLRDFIAGTAEGNPFFIEELIRMLIEDKVIVKGESNWRVRTEQLAGVHIPPTLAGVIQARLDSLPAQERTILQQASIVGRVFWDAAVQHISRNAASALVSGGDADLSLSALRHREMIARAGESAFSGCTEYFFTHTLLRDVTYESVLKRTRQVYHALAADWLITNSGDRTSELTGLIAGHLEKAGRTAEALEYLRRAAEAAVANHAVQEAIDFYARAESLTPADDLEQQYALLLGREKMLSIRGRRDAQRDILHRLTEIAGRLEDARRQAEVLIQKAWLGYGTSEYGEMAACAQQAADLADSLGDPELAGQARYALAWVALQQGSPAGAEMHALQALALARQAGNRRIEGNTLNILGLLHIARGDYFAARSYITSFVDIARELGDREREATARCNLAVALTVLGDYETAGGHGQQILEIIRETGDRSIESTALINLSWVYACQQKWNAAKEYAEAGIALKRQSEQLDAQAEGLLWLGHALLGLEQPEQAIAKYRESLALRRELGQSHLAIEVVAAIARAEHRQGNLQAARAHAGQIMDYLDSGGALEGTWEPLRIYLTCHRILKDVKDPRADRALVDGFDSLQEQASRIPDEAYRRMFLENVPWHREIVRERGAR